LKRYLALDSGELHNPTEHRYFAILFQFLLLYVFSVLALCYNYWLDTTGYLWVAGMIWSSISFIGLAYFMWGLYRSLRENIPRMVKTKHANGLFIFTLVFFEALVMSTLSWALYLLLLFLDSRLCFGYLCNGILSGCVFFVNLVTIICITVLARSRTKLGISIGDLFGMIERKT